MTDEQIKYWNKKTDESKCNWFDLYHENDIQSEINNGVKLVACVNTDNLTDNIPSWEELFNFEETHGIEKPYNKVDQELKTVRFWGGTELIKKLYSHFK